MKIVLAVFLIVGLLMAGGLLEAVHAQETGTADDEEEISQEDLLKARGTVHGKRGRRNFKTAYWAAGLEGDMKEIYEAYGYPSVRYREEKMGRIEEKWTYIEDRKQFTFRDGKLLNERDYVPSMAAPYTGK